MQFRVLRHVRLDEHRAVVGIEPGSQPVEQHFQGVLFDFRSVGVVGGQRVPVGDKEEAVVVSLHAHPVVERAHIVPQMQFAGGTHAAEHAFAMIRARGHQNLRIMESKKFSTGKISIPRNLPPK